MPIHAQVAALLESLAALGQGSLEDMPLEQARETARALAAFDGDPEPVADVSEHAIPGPAGPVALRAYRPSRQAALPLVTWFHAGGGVVGDLDTADRTCRRLANRSRAMVVSVDYRLAPEHPFPAAVEDCWAATRWLAGHAGRLGGDSARLAVGGDSMGGGLAAVVAQRAARAGWPALRHQLLVYPFTDMTLSGRSVAEFADGYLLTRPLLDWFIGHYLGAGGKASDPAASPLLADNLDGCPPATILSAEFDPVRDDAEAYARRLADEGVTVCLERFDGMIHVFFALAGVIDAALDAAEVAGNALRQALH